MCTGNKLETNEAGFLLSPWKAVKLGQHHLQLAPEQQTNVTLNMLLEVCIQYIAQYFTVQVLLCYSLNALYVFSQVGA